MITTMTADDYDALIEFFEDLADQIEEALVSVREAIADLTAQKAAEAT